MPFEEAPNWYTWRCENWGTKWDIGEDGVNPYYDYENSILKYSFNSAWSPVVPIAREMSRQYPDVLVEIFYEESGNVFAGKSSFKNGELLEEVEANDSHDYRIFCKDELGYEYIGTCPHCGCPIEECEPEDCDEDGYFTCCYCSEYINSSSINNID